MEDRPPDVPPTVPPYGATPPPPFEPPPTAPVRPPIPWEDPARPKFAAFFETVKLLYTRTREAYERMPLTSDVLKPYLFGILAGWIGTAIGTVWQMSLQSVMQGILANLPSSSGVSPNDYGFIASFVRGPILIAMAPVLTAVGILVATVIYHVFLMLVGAGKGGFAATMRVACYAQAAALFQIVPGCGSTVGAIVGLLFLIVGFAVVHRISNARATTAVLLPAFLCCVCLCIVIAIAGVAGLQQFRHAMGH